MNVGNSAGFAIGVTVGNEIGFEVGEEIQPSMTADEVNATIAQRLRDSAWAVAEDDLTITRGQRADWMAFRQALRDIPLQAGFPTTVQWPAEPA
jgi:hypothetical protein